MQKKPRKLCETMIVLYLPSLLLFFTFGFKVSILQNAVKTLSNRQDLVIDSTRNNKKKSPTISRARTHSPGNKNISQTDDAF